MSRGFWAGIGVGVCLALALLVIAAPLEGQARSRADVTVYFSPKGDALKTIKKELGRAQRTLDLALYMITAPELATAIIAAEKRGVKVRLITDARQRKRWSQTSTLEKNHVPVWHLYLRKGPDDASDPQFHHKFAVIDGHTVLTGSFNWTVMADQSNHENMLVIRDRHIAAAYTEAFERAFNLAEKQDRNKGD